MSVLWLFGVRFRRTRGPKRRENDVGGGGVSGGADGGWLCCTHSFEAGVMNGDLASLFFSITTHTHNFYSLSKNTETTKVVSLEQQQQQHFTAAAAAVVVGGAGLTREIMM